MSNEEIQFWEEFRLRLKLTGELDQRLGPELGWMAPTLADWVWEALTGETLASVLAPS